MSAKICPTCGAEYPATERFCPKDGTVLRAPTAETASLIGAVIAERYHVLEKLGEGGMGQVYLAEHVKMGRKSAVKVMHPSMVQNTDALGRFNREAANASRIDHPNVAAIYDFGETPDGLVYLAMQYVEGETLTHILQATGALPPQRAAEIARQAAEGLYAAHGLGIVHRDLKPDNIMITKDRDGLDCVKVVDFGIAKAAGNAAQQVTRTGIVVGTPEYMSPEQLAGEDVDARSDLYSLALVTFNMLTGDLPFPAASTQTSMIMRLTEPPKTLAEMKPDVAWPAEVEGVMRKALEREPSQRYASTREFGRALYAAIEQMPVRPSAVRGTLLIDPSAPAPARAAKTSDKSSVNPPPAASGPSNREFTIAAGALVAIIVIGLVAWGVTTRNRAHGAGPLAEGIAAYNQGRREAALERFRTAAARAPSNPMPHVYLSRMAREVNDMATAHDEAMKAVELGPHNGIALRELASTMFVEQNYAGARAFYVRALKVHPGDRLSQGYLGCSLLRLGRVEEGTRWIERAGNGPWKECAPGS